MTVNSPPYPYIPNEEDGLLWKRNTNKSQKQWVVFFMPKNWIRLTNIHHPSHFYLSLVHAHAPTLGRPNFTKDTGLGWRMSANDCRFSRKDVRASPSWSNSWYPPIRYIFFQVWHIHTWCIVLPYQELTTMCYSFYLLFTDPPAGWHPASWHDVLWFLTRIWYQ